MSCTMFMSSVVQELWEETSEIGDMFKRSTKRINQKQAYVLTCRV